MSLGALIDEIGREGRLRPDATAYEAPDGRVLLRYGELVRRVEERAEALASVGLGPGSVAAYGVRPSPDGNAWMLACLRAGLGIVPLDVGITPEAQVTRCQTAGVDAVILDRLAAFMSAGRLRRRLARFADVRLADPRRLGPRLLVTGRSVGRGHLAAGGRPGATADPESTALIVFTSGTTAAPRGVVHTPRSIAQLLLMARDLGGFDRSSRVLATALHLVVPALLAGGVAVMPPRRRPDMVGRVTRERDVTHVALAPFQGVAWAERGGAAPSFQRLFLGSAPLRSTALRRILPRLPAGAQVWGVYGMTQMLLVAAVEGRERVAADERDGDLVGAVLPGARVRVDDTGEVHVSGAGMARGYVGEPPLAEVATGDLGRLEGERLVLLGRRKEMIIRSGENIYPTLYEPAIVERGGVQDAAVVGIPNELGDEWVVLWIVPLPGERADVAQTRVERLVAGPDSPFDRHARPDTVMTLDELPRSGRSAKVDRRALVVLAAQRLGWPPPDDPMLPEAP